MFSNCINCGTEWLDVCPSCGYPNNEWIPCSERMPNEEGEYEVTVVSLYQEELYVSIDTYDFEDGWVSGMNIIAWKKASAPYQPKGECRWRDTALQISKLHGEAEADAERLANEYTKTLKK